MNNLGSAIEAEGRVAEAEAAFSEALRIAAPQLGDQHPRVATMMLNVARVQIAQGRAAGSDASLRQVLRVREKILSGSDWRIAEAKSLLGASRLVQKRYADAEPLMLAADQGLRPLPGPQSRERIANRARLVQLYETLQRPEQAAAFR